MWRPWVTEFSPIPKTALDWAYEIRELLTVHFPNAPKIRLVSDNLNTHVPAPLYKAFPAKEARELLRRIEFHYTPKHGSWLNIAEIMISVLSRQCLCRRIPDMDVLNAELTAWYTGRNMIPQQIKWQFTTDDVRIKLISFISAILDLVVY